MSSHHPVPGLDLSSQRRDSDIHCRCCRTDTVVLTAANPTLVAPLTADPGATDLRDARYRRRESPLDPPWAHLPSATHSALPANTRVKLIAVSTDRYRSGVTLDLFC